MSRAAVDHDPVRALPKLAVQARERLPLAQNKAIGLRAQVCE